jgi:hypothetical protein
MNKNILASLVRLNETETLLAVKPLHSSRSHGRSSFKISVRFKPRPRRGWLTRILGRRVVSQARKMRRGQVVRPKLDRRYMADARRFSK